MRGGYYTPPRIARFLTEWAIRSPDDRVLEPSCGDGNLLCNAAARLLDLGADGRRVGLQLSGVEWQAEEAAQARARLSEMGISDAACCVAIGDFFALCRRRWLPAESAELQRGLFEDLSEISHSHRFDVVVGNPPFIRYQNFPEAHRAAAFEIMREVGLRPNGLTNAWAPFLVAGVRLLSEHGRLAMVIPAELFQVGYAAAIREYLSQASMSFTIVTFKRLVFDGIQQEIVLLLGEKIAPDGNEQDIGIRVVELEDADALDDFVQAQADAEAKPLDHSCEKWTQYFLDRAEIDLLRELRQHARLPLSGRVLDVDVGVVTGQNKFFILNEAEARARALNAWTSPVVTRSSHLSGAHFSLADWRDNAASGHAVHLLRAPEETPETLPAPVLAYVREGESEGVEAGYKCRIRKKWYVVPSVWTPDAFMLRQVHGYPKLVLNGAGATCTDTIHRVRFLTQCALWQELNLTPQGVTGAFINSLTFAFSEVTGRSYGGGVLTFEPSEAEILPLPLHGAAQLDFEAIDAHVRMGNINAVLDMADRVLLRDGLGLDKSEISMVRGIWYKMRDRRIYRKKPGAAASK